MGEAEDVPVFCFRIGILFIYLVCLIVRYIFIKRINLTISIKHEFDTAICQKTHLLLGTRPQ